MKIILFSWLLIICFYSTGLIFSTNQFHIIEDQNHKAKSPSSINNTHSSEKPSKISFTMEEDILVSLGSDTKYSPATAVDSNKHLWTAYTYYNTTSTNYTLDILTSTNGGVNWTRKCFIYHDYWIDNPEIAIDLYTNNVYVVFDYGEIGNDSSGNIGLGRYNQTHLAIFGVETDSDNQRNPSIAIDINNGNNNQIYVAYEHVINDDNRKLVVKRSIDKGSTWDVWHSSGYGNNFVHTSPDLITDFFGIVYVTYAFGATYDNLLDIQIEYGPRNSSTASFENLRYPFSSSSGTVNYPVIAISRSALFSTRIVIAFQCHWSETDNDVFAASSVDGGRSWLLSFVGYTDYWEGKPNIVSDGMDVSSSVLGNFYIIYGFATAADEWFVISQAPYSNPTNWTTLEFYWGTKDILMTTNNVFGVTAYSNTNSTLIVTYAADQIFLANYTTGYVGTDAFITIISPNITTVWNAQNTERIEWTTFGVINNVDILLIKGNTIVEWIVENISNTGYYDWEVPTSRETGTDYSVAITDSINSRIFSSSFQFEIINTNFTYPSIYYTNPTPVSAWRAGATYVITWNCKIDLGEVTLELLKDGEVVDTLSDDTDGESHFKWEIPDEISKGDDYQLKISLNSNPNIYGISKEFKIIAPRTPQTATTRTVILPTPGYDLTILIFGLIICIIYRKRKRCSKSH